MVVDHFYKVGYQREDVALFPGISNLVERCKHVYNVDAIVITKMSGKLVCHRVNSDEVKELCSLDGGYLSMFVSGFPEDIGFVKGVVLSRKGDTHVPIGFLNRRFTGVY